MLVGLSIVYPDRLTVEVHEHATRDEYMAWLTANREAIGAPGHRSSPFVWFEPGHVLGGCDDTIAWAKNTFSLSPTTDAPARAVPNVDAWNSDVSLTCLIIYTLN